MRVVVPAGKGRVGVTLTTHARVRATSRFTYAVAARTATVVGANDLGMHCVDKDFSVFSILPPYNVLTAQVLVKNSQGVPVVLGANDVELRYSAVADAAGSINSYSIGKTNFWDYALPLFGATLAPGQGLKGLYMPAEAPTTAQHSFGWNGTLGLFDAQGIPLYPLDDAHSVNRYPLLRVTALSKVSGATLGHLDVVAPVSEETTCARCHTTGGRAATGLGISWASDADKDKEARLNVLKLHDYRSSTSLFVSQPVLCAQCHYSPALDLAGSGPSPTQQTHSSMSRVMHSFHADKMIDQVGVALNDSAVARDATPPTADRQACYTCHPGTSTKCLRGAMSTILDCQNCHGNMAAVGGDNVLLSNGSIDGNNDGGGRRPWKDLPRCQSCHSGDAVSHLNPSDPSQHAADNLRFLYAYTPGDASASPLKAVNMRFAEETGKLYRHSKGHGGIACEHCHGSTHAIWGSAALGTNDDVAPLALQGHPGALGECSTCHTASSLALTVSGPHGMHNVNDARWIDGGHARFYKQSPALCKACHGLTLHGSVLSRAFSNRTFRAEDIGTVTVLQGDQVGCYTCHNGPNGGG